MPQIAYDSVQASLYDEYAIQNDYELAEGVFALPLAQMPPGTASGGDGTLADWSPVVLVRAHAPHRVRRMSFSVVKKQAPPVLPRPADAGAFKFVGGGISAPVPTMGPDQSNFNWRVAGQYVFVEDVVSRPEDGLVLGMQPWAYQSQVENITALGGTPPALATAGAIAEAGTDAQVGLAQAGVVDFTKPYWYNTPSFLPGTFFSDDRLVNGGPPVAGG